MNVKDMPLMEHIVELRKRLVIIAMFLLPLWWLVFSR